MSGILDACFLEYAGDAVPVPTYVVILIWHLGNLRFDRY